MIRGFDGLTLSAIGSHRIRLDHAVVFDHKRLLIAMIVAMGVVVEFHLIGAGWSQADLEAASECSSGGFDHWRRNYLGGDDALFRFVVRAGSPTPIRTRAH